MDVRVTIVETRQVHRTYFVKGVDSLETAEKCAQRCLKHQYQPNTYLWLEVPYSSFYETNNFEIVNSS